MHITAGLSYSDNSDNLRTTPCIFSILHPTSVLRRVFLSSNVYRNKTCEGLSMISYSSLVILTTVMECVRISLYISLAHTK